MTRSTLLRPALAVGIILAALPAFAAGGINSNNSMPNRISMNCTTAKGAPVTDPAVCASEGCIDAHGKPVTDVSTCSSSSGTHSADPAPAEGKVTKSRSNIQNN